jgi:hypothetical protein
MAYVYSPINSSSVRLFKYRLAADGSILGELETVRLASAHRQRYQPYRAVSYTWGTSGYTESITVDGHQVPILEAVHSFLLQMAADHELGWWWIDSICIDQKNEVEKGHQVALMAQIFVHALETRVWLGPEAEDSARAMRFLLWMCEQNFSHGSNNSLREVVADQEGLYVRDWTAVKLLFKRAWWTRAWTVQEYVVPDYLVISCGASSIRRDQFQLALESIYDCGVHLDSTAQWNRTRLLERSVAEAAGDFTTKNISSLGARKQVIVAADALAPRSARILPMPSKPTPAMAKISRTANGASLVATLAYLGDHCATDPRDRVYSLLGMVRDMDLAGVPDYSQNVSILYTKIARDFIKKYRSLDIICMATIFQGEFHYANTYLPSWVPDWRVKVYPLVVPTMVSQEARHSISNLRPLIQSPCSVMYSASRMKDPEVSITQNGHQLTCLGFMISIIDRLAGTPQLHWATSSRPASPMVQTASSNSAHSETGREEEQSVPSLATISEVLRSIVRCLVLDRQDHYLNDRANDLKFLSQVLTLLNETRGPESTPWNLFREWYNTNKNFRIDTCTLHVLISRLLARRVVFTALPDERNRRSFYSRFHDTMVKMSRRLVVLQNGWLGTAPSRARQGDLVCILYGCSVPVVLRQTPGEDTYSFVGECYVDGYMKGEALDTCYAEKECHFTLV